MFTVAVFQVIHDASALTSSSVRLGWKRTPPFAGPRAMLCCTRKPVNTFTCPLSSFTGIATSITRRGVRRICRRPGIQLQELRRHIELHLRDAIRVQVLPGRHPRNDRLWNSLVGTGHLPSSSCSYALALLAVAVLAARQRLPGPQKAVAAFGGTKVLDLARLL